VDPGARSYVYRATGSETNPFILITTSVEGCVNGHEGHEPGGNDDIFPTQGCAD
jgi:hypothetical protein